MAFEARFSFPLSLTLVILSSVFFSQDRLIIVDIAPVELLRESLELLYSVGRGRAFLPPGSLFWGGLGVGSVCPPFFLRVTVERLEDTVPFQLSTAPLPSESQGSN